MAKSALSPSFAKPRALREDLLGLVDVVEADVELGERTVERERVRLASRSPSCTSSSAPASSSMWRSTSASSKCASRDGSRIELDRLLERRLRVAPARRALHRLTREREAVLEEVVRVLRRELLRLRARGRDLVPLLLLLYASASFQRIRWFVGSRFVACSYFEMAPSMLVAFALSPSLARLTASMLLRLQPTARPRATDSARDGPRESPSSWRRESKGTAALAKRKTGA